MPFNIGPGELIIVLVIALIVVGPGKLPDVGAALGKGLREFRQAASEAKDVTSLEPARPVPAAPAPVATPPAQAAIAPSPVAPAPAPMPVAAGAPPAPPTALPVTSAPASAEPGPGDPRA